MVSVARSNALEDPTSVLQELFLNHKDDFASFAAVVSEHFKNIFADESAFLEIPSISLRNHPNAVSPRSLVRFRGMVQDTLSPEIYASIFNANGTQNNLGGWGLADSVEIEEDEVNLDYSKLQERSPLWVVSVPGESEWVEKRFNAGETATDCTDSGTSTDNNMVRTHKHPLNTPHLGMSVKSTEVLTFVGILSFDSLPISDFDPFTPVTTTAPQVPTIHVLYTRAHPRSIVPFSYPFYPTLSPGNEAREADLIHRRESFLKLREDLVSWVAEEALCGDREAAEWVLLIVVSRVHSRNPEILPPSLTISSFPSPSNSPTTKPVPSLHALLTLLVPLTVHLNLPANLIGWSEPPPPSATTNAAVTPAPAPIHFAPHSENEDLHAGVLQLAAGTVLTIIETDVKEGTLPTQVVENLHTLRSVLRRQSLQYRFPFSSGVGYEFPTDLPSIVLCGGGSSQKSVFLPDADIVLPLLPSNSEKSTEWHNPYKGLAEIALPSPEKLDAFRHIVCGAMAGKVKVNESVAKYIQTDFVQERSSSVPNATTITPEDLMLRLNLARLLALTYHEPEVTREIWDKVKALDKSRREKCAR